MSLFEILTSKSILLKNSDKFLTIKISGVFDLIINLLISFLWIWSFEKDSKLSNICKIQERYDCIIGQSDHTNDIKVPIYAAAAGLQILEKHFKMDDEF